MKYPGQPTRFFQFPATQWELVEQAREGSDGERQQALEALCHLYWLPLYSFVRRKGHSAADAEDATQGFLASFLKRGDFSRMHPSEGKMRTFLLRSLTNFLNCEYRFQSRIKRGGGVPNFSLQEMESEGRYHDLPLENTTPERLFDRVWAFELLGRVLGRMEIAFEEKGKGVEFRALKPFLNPSGNEPSHKEVAARLGVETQALKTMIFRLRQRYRDELREAVEETLVPGADAEEEMRCLIEILAE